eukprot:CAMPEP_0202706156 /NCGR_PEP_ID=MMETSP1385-20130828/18618_1 /ASSEMBLY_ACC=CAM_ASM_000861 /TAXON_ID=933848 /ORGANISM="Elphidium margaritaceum" /LENGTH=165 /DNA_ID=CAMNT_0049364563 /DNA_START=30 /DNA_END=527 /DNA_ORIENTATION=+
MPLGIGVPVKLLHECVGHIICIETVTGEMYRGQLDGAEDSMNIRVKNVTHWDQTGKTRHLDNMYIRGSKIRFVIVPDMLKHAPMFKRLDPAYKKYGTGLGMGRGMKEMQQDRSNPGGYKSNSARARGRGGRGGRGFTPRGQYGDRGGGGRGQSYGSGPSNYHSYK